MKLLGKLDAKAMQTVLEAAADKVRDTTITHFDKRNTEPANSTGFPRFGQVYPKSNFWAGVAASVGQVSIQDDTATINIDSPALAHKAADNPPPITPKGGRKYLAIPANARSAAFDAMPRAFLGGDMRFGYAPTPEGKWMPALLATRDHLRTVKRGKKAGQRVMAAGKSATTGVSTVQYWLVRKVQTRHDPNAIPSDESLKTAATRAAVGALRKL